MSNIRNMTEFETYKINFNDKDDYNYYVYKFGGHQTRATDSRHSKMKNISPMPITTIMRVNSVMPASYL